MINIIFQEQIIIENNIYQTLNLEFCKNNNLLILKLRKKIKKVKII